MLKIEEAQKIILEFTPLAGVEEVDILSSLGRVLREDVVAPWDFPRFDNSAMDGYALRAEDTVRATPEEPAVLKLVGEVKAGETFQGELKPGEAVRIFTGAPIPPGANAVEIQEEVKVGDGVVSIFRSVPPGFSIRYRGEDLPRGEVVLPKFSELGPGELSVLAAVAKSRVLVSRRPKVAILSTGDELVSLDQRPEGGQIVDSNRYGLAAQVLRAGGEPLLLPLVPDVPELIEKQIYEGLEHSDILLTSGGVSVGEYDFVKECFQKFQVREHFWKVAMKPGKPLFFGTLGEKQIFGLPGNPVSSLVSFELFVRPAIRKRLGLKELFRPKLSAITTRVIRPTGKRTSIIRGNLNITTEKVEFTPYPRQGSGNPLSMVSADGWAVIPPGDKPLSAGSSVEVMLIV